MAMCTESHAADQDGIFFGICMETRRLQFITWFLEVTVPPKFENNLRGMRFWGADGVSTDAEALCFANGVFAMSPLR